MSSEVAERFGTGNRQKSVFEFVPRKSHNLFVTLRSSHLSLGGLGFDSRWSNGWVWQALLGNEGYSRFRGSEAAQRVITTWELSGNRRKRALKIIHFARYALSITSWEVFWVEGVLMLHIYLIYVISAEYHGILAEAYLLGSRQTSIAWSAPQNSHNLFITPVSSDSEFFLECVSLGAAPSPPPLWHFEEGLE